MAEPEPTITGPEAMELTAGVHHLCSCRRSRQGWFCDGAHLGSGRVSYELRLAVDSTVQLCGCSGSKRYPLCDGSHAKAAQKHWLMWWCK